MPFPSVRLTCNCDSPHVIDVVVTKVSETPCHSYKFTATLDGTTYELVMTVSPVDGPIPQPTLEQLQKDVDSHRQLAADHAHARHLIKELESQVK